MPGDHRATYHGDEVFDDLLVGDELALTMSATPDGSRLLGVHRSGQRVRLRDRGLLRIAERDPLTGPIYDSVATPSGHGYWMVGNDGGVFAFGDAHFYGSMGGIPLNRQVMAMAPDPDGVGYWLVASDGGVSPSTHRSTVPLGSIPLNQPVSGIVASPTGHGYLMTAFDGGVFTFGDVPFHGSLGSTPPAAPVYTMAVMP